MVKSNKKRVYITLRKTTLEIISKELEKSDLSLSEVVDDLLIKYFIERNR